MAVCLFVYSVPVCYICVHALYMYSLPFLKEKKYDVFSFLKKEVINILNFTTSTSILSNDSFQDHVHVGGQLSRLVKLVCL